MAKKRLRVLLLASAIVLLCLALIVAGTYALFSDSVSVNNHLQAGTLKVKLMREKLTYCNLAADGTMENSTDNTLVDFTGTTEENIFGLTDKTKIVPTSSFTADMIISCAGDVAFTYWIEIVLDPSAEDLSFAEQLTISVTPEGGETLSKSLSEGLNVGDEAHGIATVKLNEQAKFSVCLSFDDLANEVNNNAQDKKISFDLIVHAVQATA